MWSLLSCIRYENGEIGARRLSYEANLPSVREMLHLPVEGTLP